MASLASIHRPTASSLSERLPFEVRPVDARHAFEQYEQYQRGQERKDDDLRTRKPPRPLLHHALGQLVHMSNRSPSRRRRRSATITGLFQAAKARSCRRRSPVCARRAISGIHEVERRVG